MLSLSEEARAAHDANRTGGPHHARCLAPFTSMYFDQFGNVLACCINTVQPLGSYPRDRISDIWRGARAKKLRAALADDDFSLGCHDCHRSIESGNFTAVNALFDQVADSTPPRWVAEHPPEPDDQRDPWPRMLEFALSTRCNLTCTMCNAQYSSAIRKAEGLAPLPDPYDDAFIEELRPFLEHVTAVKFYGGEPFLAPSNFAIWEALEELNPSCEVAITTNGTVWTDRVRRVVENLNTSITVSIDAAASATFESIRRGASHDDVLRNLDRFARAERCQVSLAVCAMRQNWREIPDLVRFANRNDWHIGFNVVRYPQDHSLSSASSDQLQAVIECWEGAVEDLAQEGGSVASGANLQHLANMLADVRGWRDAAGYPSSGVEIRSGSAAGAQTRRREWLEMVASLAGRSWDPGAVRTEDGFQAELDRLLVAFDEVVPAEAHGPLVAHAVATHLDSPGGPDVDRRFDQLGDLLASASVSRRLRLMAVLPPALIAQGVAHERSEMMALRFDAYFPPSGRRPDHDEAR